MIELDKGGLMVGVMIDGIEYETGNVTLEENDVLVMYTDGVTEAQNILKDDYGDERLITLVKENVNDNAGKTIGEDKRFAE